MADDGARGWKLGTAANWFWSWVSGDDGPQSENEAMLRIYLGAIKGRYIALRAEDAETAELKFVKALVDRLDALEGDASASEADASKKRPPTWADAWSAERALVRHTPGDMVLVDLARRLEELRALDAGAHAVLHAQWTEAKAGSVAETARRAQDLLISALEQLEWVAAKRQIVRKLADTYAGRLHLAFYSILGFAVFFVLLEIWGRGYLFQDSLRGAPGLSGIGFAAAAGMLGAMFSAMSSQSSIYANANIEAVRTAVSRKMIRLRVAVGLGAALIVYFAFDADIIGGSVFPKLNQIGFTAVETMSNSVTNGEAAKIAGERFAQLERALGRTAELLKMADDDLKPMNALFETVRSRQGDVLDLTKIKEPLARAELWLQSTLEPEVNDLKEKFRAYREALESTMTAVRLGAWAPNADLCKLVIWCFVAGFAEKFVPDLLAKAKAKAEADGAK